MVATDQTKAAMQKAKQYIQAKEYGKARKLLERVDHPTAKKWLAQLDDIELGDPFENVRPKAKADMPSFATKYIVTGLLLLLLWPIGFLAVFVYAGEAKRAMAEYGDKVPYAKNMLWLRTIAILIGLAILGVFILARIV